MTRLEDFDQQLRDWSDVGDERIPSRYLEAALARINVTPQRGASWWPLGGLLMKLKPAAPILGIAAVILVAIAGYQLFGRTVGGPNTPTAAPRIIAAADLPHIVLTDANAPEGFAVDTTTDGVEALVTPLSAGGPFIDQSAFVGALMTRLNITETGGYVSYAALFETAAAAEIAYDYLVDEHGEVGWGMTRSSEDPGLGDQSASFTGPAYDNFETNVVHLWRVDNVVLAAVAVGDVAVGDANADLLLELAQQMDDQAR
jgi:hypothetical protein